MKLQQLNEALFKTDELVDYIYDVVYSKFFDQWIDYSKGKIPKTPIEIKPMKLEPDLILKHIKDPVIRKAMEINPVTIIADYSDYGSAYNPLEKNMRVTPHRGLMTFLNNQIRQNISFEDALMDIPSHQRKNAVSEINGMKMKVSIAHEVSHWLNDTYHGKHITKMLQTTVLTKNSKGLYRGKQDLYMTDYEIDAMIHGVYQLKRKHTEQQWNQLSFDDLLQLEPGLRTIHKRLKTEFGLATVQQWKKDMKKRLFRERLLGKFMR